MTIPDLDHAVHDELLIVAFASDDLTGPEREQAATLVAACSDCAALAADVGAIVSATKALDAPARPRDFRLTDADASRLTRRPLLGRVADALLGVGGIGQPVAVVLTTLGLAGLLLGTVPGSLSFGSAGAAPVLSKVGGTVPEAAGAASAPASGGQGDRQGVSQPAASAAGSAVGGVAFPPVSPAPSPAPDKVAQGPSATPCGPSSCAPSAFGGGPVVGPVGRPSAAPSGAYSGGAGSDQSLSAAGGVTSSAPGSAPFGQSIGLTLSAGLLVLGILLFAARRVAARRSDSLRS